MKILVTGASGFTGNRMMEYLTAQGAIEPVGLIRRSNLMNERETKSFIVADLLAPESLHTAITGLCPDAVIHLAGLNPGHI